MKIGLEQLEVVGQLAVIILAVVAAAVGLVMADRPSASAHRWRRPSGPR